ncbi:MAG: restriction endonuclease subunit S [Verrucomicrobiota bacterium]
MISNLQPYPDYKESEQAWLGRVPQHWELRPAFGAYLPNREKNTGMKEKTVLSLSYGRIVIKPPEKLHGLVPASFETYQIVNPGDIVIRTTDLQNDHTSLRVAMVRNRGIITSAYLALHTKEGVNPSFGYQFLNVWDLTKAIYGFGSGLRQGLDFIHFKRMPVAIPPPDEQAAIVRFLDYANGRLERAIRSKRKVITLLHKQKQAIIHRAVTRGLDPTVHLKPSGIPWLGDIPEHWERTRLKFEASHIVDCLHATPSYRSDGFYPAIRTADIEPGRVRLERARKISEAEFKRWTARLKPEAGDILYSREGERFGIAANVPPATELCISQRMMVFRIRKRQNSEYLMWQLNCQHVYLQASLYVIGSTAPHVNVDQIKNFQLAVPPLHEQKTIIEYISAECGVLSSAIARLEREISLLREYRTRLVADVVTGKLDVREAAAKLPELPVEPLAPEPEESSEPEEVES